jgi:KDO2-lipid IV(A) lauroyltransferase
MTEETVQNREVELPIPFKKKLERFVGRVALRLLLGPIRAMPWSVACGFGHGLGAVLYRVLGRYRRVAHKNLTLVYGKEKSPGDIAQMARAVFRHFGATAVEFVKLPQLGRAEVDALIEVEGEENLCRALEMGNGVLLITGHIGQWEIMARWLTTHHYPLNVIARDARDPEATKLLTETRVGSGANVLYRGGSARAILQRLKKGEIVAILPDQNATDVIVPFLGFPTGTADGPAALHLKTQAALLFSWCVRLPDNRFRLSFEPPEIVPPAENKQASIERIMTLINARLETQVRRYPTQWLWLHDRWKASPGVFPEGEENARLLKMSPNQYRAEVRRKKDK